MPDNVVLRADVFVTGREVLSSGWVDIRAGRIFDVGAGTPPGRALDLGPRIVVPGFVDMHAHGGGGHSYGSTSREDVVGAVLYHRNHHTDREPGHRRSARTPSTGADAQGPRRRPHDSRHPSRGSVVEQAPSGAHAKQHLRDPRLSEVTKLLQAGGGGIRRHHAPPS